MKHNTLPTLRAPKGFAFKVIETKYNVLVQLLQKMDDTYREAGRIDMDKSTRRKQLYTHSELRADLRGKGLGTLMYSKAIEWALKHGYSIRSSGASSEMARRVWEGKGIRQHFSIRRRKNQWSPAWYAYAKRPTQKRRANGRFKSR